jgi:superfamily II DNA/RNA helicase
MSNIDAIINSIKEIFNMSEENISSLSVMLNNIDSNHIFNKFGLESEEYSFSKDELISRTNLLNALMEIILENPNLDIIKKDERKKILITLYGTTASLYEQLLEQYNDNIFEDITYLVMYSMLSYLADKQTISNLVIEEYNEKLLKNKYMLHNMDTIKKLEFNIYYLIILMVSNIKNYDGLVNLNSNINNAQKLLDEAQEIELSKDEINIENGMKISSFGNIIYLTVLLKEYLFAGKITSEENQDIYSLIDIYSYNAFHLLGMEDIELKIVGHLLKYTYEQIADNSIWNIAEKSPMIRQFIENNLSDKNKYIYSLLPSQRDVISEVLTPKKSIIVGMPTSSGKSLLAEMQILFSLHNYKTEDYKPTVCYVVPTNALIDQVKRDLKEDFKGFEFNIETALPFYDVDEIEEEILTRKHIDILISTPEKLESLIRQEHSSISNMRLVIMDEAHNLGDKSRGSKFELLLAAVKHKMKDVNFMLLSPFISNGNQIGEWLADSEKNSAVISMEWTPTRQYIGCNLLKKHKFVSVLEFYKSSRNQLSSENIEIKLRSNPFDVKEELGESSLNTAVKLCIILNDFIEQDGNILILCEGSGTSKNLANQIAKYYIDNGKLKDISSKPEINKALEIIKLESNEEDVLLECIKYGVCYHNSGLSSLVKGIIEELIRNNHVKLIFATTTLAQGMNFPINTVIFQTVKFRGHEGRDFTNAEFWNIAGRAGRAYKDKEGYIILSYANSQKETRNKVKRYIKADLEEVISSLNVFFFGDNQISFDYNFLKNTDNAPVLNLMQYINHVLNIGYDYNINPMDMAKIRTILNDSFLYHSLSKEEGYINAQRKLNTFVTQYVRHINDKKKDDLLKADKLGISDVSYSKVKSIVGAFISGLKEQGDNEYKASEVILQTKNLDRLAKIIEIIDRIPEIKIEMSSYGKFDPSSIAKLLLGWVNGEKIGDIAARVRREDQSLQDAIEVCNRYLNSQMKSYMPWGINIYQELSYDLNTDNAKMLPSYIYYGVSDKEAVIISKAGVPRFAAKNVLHVLKSEHSEVEISVKNLETLRELIREIEPNSYHIENVSGNIIKEIVDNMV